MYTEPTCIEEAELNSAIESILKSKSKKKLIIAGPGTGKTTLFKRILEQLPGESKKRIVLTFINNLKDDLEKDLGDFSQVFTLHSYCIRLLHRHKQLRYPLSANFRCYPGLASIIAEDWEIIHGSQYPKFVYEMRCLNRNGNIDFYMNRGNYYDAVDFDDSEFRAYNGLTENLVEPEKHDLVLIDEYQDFNALEAGIINLLGKQSNILIAGDDDQALYSQLRQASWDHIRRLYTENEFEVFELTFCMRCTKVIVESISDIIKEAKARGKLQGRINKPYKHYPPVKGEDSKKYNQIINVETSVQSKKSNYMGRYIEQAIRAMPKNEIEYAIQHGFDPVLVIATKPYNNQIYNYLTNVGIKVKSNINDEKKNERNIGISILKEDKDSNLGWRIILSYDDPILMKKIIKSTTDCSKRIASLIPSIFKDIILDEVENYEGSSSGKNNNTEISDEIPVVRVTSFEGAKGLSAQYVFIAGLHDGNLPYNPNNIKDIEICKFIVGLTRTRKQCTFLHTKHFGNRWMTPSKFIAWINNTKLDYVKVDKTYW